MKLDYEKEKMLFYKEILKGCEDLSAMTPVETIHLFNEQYEGWMLAKQSLCRRYEPPVAWMVGGIIFRVKKTAESQHEISPNLPVVPLYTAQPAPAMTELSDEQITVIWNSLGGVKIFTETPFTGYGDEINIKFARAIIQAVKEQK